MLLQFSQYSPFAPSTQPSPLTSIVNPTPLSMSVGPSDMLFDQSLPLILLQEVLVSTDTSVKTKADPTISTIADLRCYLTQVQVLSAYGVSGPMFASGNTVIVAVHKGHIHSSSQHAAVQTVLRGNPADGLICSRHNSRGKPITKSSCHYFFLSRDWN